MDYLGWLDDLRIRGVVSLEERQAIAHMLRSERPSVRAQGLGFCNRMKTNNPDLWIAFNPKGVSPTHTPTQPHGEMK